MVDITLDSKISDLNVTVRVVNALKNNDAWYGLGDPILTVRQVCERSPEELLRITNFGRVSLKDLEDQLALHGFHLAAGLTRRERETEAKISALQASVAGLRQRIEELRAQNVTLAGLIADWKGQGIALDRGIAVEVVASRRLEYRIQKLEECAGLRSLSLQVPA